MNDNKLKVYLDNCCFNRMFDDQSNQIIVLEAIAVEYILLKIVHGDIYFVWSFVLDYENGNNPFKDKSKIISKWKSKAYNFIEKNDNILIFAKKYIDMGLKAKDALHVACAVDGKCNYFITTDNGIIKKKNYIKEVEIINPIDLVLIMGGK